MFCLSQMQVQMDGHPQKKEEGNQLQPFDFMLSNLLRRLLRSQTTIVLFLAQTLYKVFLSGAMKRGEQPQPCKNGTC